VALNSIGETSDIPIESEREVRAEMADAFAGWAVS
jgi:hypothetical protein